MASGHYDPPLAAADILLKDLDAACDLARQTVTLPPMTPLAGTISRLLKARGRGKDDPATLISLLGQDRLVPPHACRRTRCDR
jgi:3-hydroxyisobutyrate dehydrogenase-like beta-hydroxyacid dehydrogenase